MLRYGEKGNGAAAHVTRARAIRGRSRRLPLVAFVFVLFFFSVCFGRLAFADDWHKVLYRSELDGARQYIVAADDRYQAAAIICGRNMNFIANLDAATRQKLSTQGGSFQTLAEGLDDDWPAWNESTLEDSLSETFGFTLWFNMTNDFMVTDAFPFTQFNGDALSVFTVVDWQSNCPNHIYAANLDQTLIAAANEAINIIVGGGSISSGGTGNFSDVNTFTLYHSPHSHRNPSYYLVGGTRYYLGGTKDLYMPDNVTVTFSGMQINGLPSLAEGQYYYCYTMTSGYVTVYAASEPFYAYATTTDDFGVEVVTQARTHADKIYYARVSSSYSYDGGTTMTRTFDSVFNMEQFGSNTVQWTDGVYESINADVGGGGGGGDDEPNPWPEPEPDPPTPTPPDPPTPTPRDPITPIPPDPPTNDPTVIVQTVPSGTDYTDYLKAIIRQLNQITEDMATHCKHIRDAIYSGVENINDNVVNCVNEINQVLDQSFAGLLDYLEDLTKWYETFTKRLHDDLHLALDDMTSLLRQILHKIGIGRGGGQSDIDKQIDDDFDFLEWLINFIASKLSGVIGDFVGDVGALLNGIKDKFPFSIPWDIMAILALLDGTPVTPRFTITIPAINGWWSATSFVIDLSEYNSVASVARFMINAWWVLVLAMKTDWMLMIMGNHTSLGERFANRVTGGE